MDKIKIYKDQLAASHSKWTALGEIPYGEIRTYKQIAENELLSLEGVTHVEVAGHERFIF